MIDHFLPMLCCAAEPFDSPAHSFEIKWDGIRGLAAIEAGGWQMWGRREEADLAQRYPELEGLRRLPSGTVVDGEVILLDEQRPSLAPLLARHALNNPRQIRHAAQQRPVTYMLFDVLYARGKSLLNRPYLDRRQVLEQLVAQLTDRDAETAERIGFSQGTREHGKRTFQSVVAHGHEGLVAKHIEGRYYPGRRHPAWQKIKAVQALPAVVIGYRGRDRVRSLMMAAPDPLGQLQFVAHVTSGISQSLGQRLLGQLAPRRRRQSAVACDRQATWVDPVLFCRIHFLRRTARGRLREARLAGLIENA